MEKEELMEKADEMKSIMGETELLENLMKAMTAKELQENLEYINSMYDMDLF